MRIAPYVRTVLEEQGEVAREDLHNRMEKLSGKMIGRDSFAKTLSYLRWKKIIVRHGHGEAETYTLAGVAPGSKPKTLGAIANKLREANGAGPMMSHVASTFMVLKKILQLTTDDAAINAAVVAHEQAIEIAGL